MKLYKFDIDDIINNPERWYFYYNKNHRSVLEVRDLKSRNELYRYLRNLEKVFKNFSIAKSNYDRNKESASFEKQFLNDKQIFIESVEEINEQLFLRALVD